MSVLIIFIPLVSIGVNECQDPANCKNGHCVDTQDSYYCICNPPWILATDRNSCVTPEEQAGEWGGDRCERCIMGCEVYLNLELHSIKCYFGQNWLKTVSVKSQ